jgi:hypothetical protein
MDARKIQRGRVAVRAPHLNPHGTIVMLRLLSVLDDFPEAETLDSSSSKLISWFKLPSLGSPSVRKLLSFMA